MSRKTTDSEYRRSQLIVASIYILLVGVFGAATAIANTVDRSSSSKQYLTGGRSLDSAPVETRDTFAPLATEGKRESSRSTEPRALRSAKPSAGLPLAAAGANDFWIHDADVVIFGDDDGDGFFYGIDLLFDADTIWDSAAVYAVLYLSLEGGPWNEYAVTEDFRIAGARAGDEFVIVTELESGYPTGDYDLLIELFDADTGVFLADFGPEMDSGLSFLPLEDFNRDAPLFDVPVTVSSSRGGGGSTGIVLAVLLSIALLSRAARRRPVLLRKRAPRA